ncbi:hypothetical protein V1478_010039 [Vespula squamosa]|uniref:Uncharacterized protein n=1 Tax=Vespula squamosa TaxID=30214 RepID=A0ABD2AIM5_VESSQ
MIKHGKAKGERDGVECKLKIIVVIKRREVNEMDKDEDEEENKEEDEVFFYHRPMWNIIFLLEYSLH